MDNFSDKLDRHDSYATIDRLDRTARAAIEGRGRGLQWRNIGVGYKAHKKVKLRLKMLKKEAINN